MAEPEQNRASEFLVEHGRLMEALAKIDARLSEHISLVTPRLEATLNRLELALYGPQGMSDRITRLEQSQLDCRRAQDIATHRQSAQMGAIAALVIGVLVSLIVTRIEGCDRVLHREALTELHDGPAPAR